MYQFFLILQWAGIIISLCSILYISSKKPSLMQSRILRIDLFILINYIGYYLELTADNKELAIQAVKVSYIGKPFILLTLVLSVLECCRVNMPKYLKWLLTAIHLSISILVLTCESHNLFYSSIGWTEEGIFPHLVLGHSIIYNLYSSLVVVYFVVAVAIMIRRYRRLNNIIEKKQLHIIFMLIICSIAGFVWFLSGTTNGYDTTLPAYLIAVILLTVAVSKYQLLDTVSFAKEDALDYYKDGFMVLDNENSVIYQNKMSETIIDNLEKAGNNIDIKALLNVSQKKPYLFADDKVYEVIEREISRKNIRYGTLITMQDISDQYFYAKRLAKEVKEKTEEVVFIQHSVLTSLATIIEARDGITGLHIKNTSDYVKILVDAIKASDKYKNLIYEEQAKAIIEAAPLHDIGKIAVPDYVLKKPGKLTKEEFDIIKQHPEQGAKIIDETLASVESLYLETARKMAYYHHEKWDGTGYPCGLKGEEIPICARIMAIADVYDALLSNRSYKDAFSKEQARKIMEESSGSHFDPVLVKIFFDNID